MTMRNIKSLHALKCIFLRKWRENAAKKVEKKGWISVWWWWRGLQNCIIKRLLKRRTNRKGKERKEKKITSISAIRQPEINPFQSTNQTVYSRIFKFLSWTFFHLFKFRRMYVYACVCTYAGTCFHTSVHPSACLCMCVCASIHPMSMYVCFLSVCVCMREVYVFSCVSFYVYILFIYICAGIFIHRHTYAHICIRLSVGKCITFECECVYLWTYMYSCIRCMWSFTHFNSFLVVTNMIENCSAYTILRQIFHD